MLAQHFGLALDRAGRVPVEPDLTIAGHPEILVIGDLASFLKDGKQLPGVAPTAIQQGHYAAKLVMSRVRGERIKPFHYFDKGSLATIGRNQAVAQIGPLQFSGILAWLGWLFIHLLYIVEFENRLLIVVQWAYDYFTYNRGARLITGEAQK
jgi:NADH dehydrogenase